MATEAPGYRPGNILDKEPTIIAAAIFAVVNFVIAAGSWTVDPDVILQGNTALVLVLSLFVRAKSTSNSTAQVLVEKAASEAATQAKGEVDDFLLSVHQDQQAAELSLAQEEVQALRAAVAPKKAAPVKKAAKKAPRPH